MKAGALWRRPIELVVCLWGPPFAMLGHHRLAKFVPTLIN